ncbi:MAG: hypothetical protein ACWA42_05460 [Lutibacter sp.]
MKRKIKLIWDFRGMDAEKTAAHQAKHLNEFALKENLFYFATSFQKITEMYAIAFIIIKEVDLTTYRDALIPHRAEIA